MTKLEEMFSAQSAGKEGIIRRNKKHIERLIGFDALLQRVKREQFHLIETGEQYIIICNPGVLKIHC